MLKLKLTLQNYFLKLIDSEFPKGHQLHKFINRNTVKVSYSTMPSLAQRIEKNNRKLEKNFYNEEKKLEGKDKTCSCQNMPNEW